MEKNIKKEKKKFSIIRVLVMSAIGLLILATSCLLSMLY